jgi:glycosyltransferase involved in cell wall biosynthesis
LPKLKDYDFIQLVNEHAIGGVPWIERRQLKRLKKQNKHMVLLCCGEDYNIIHYCLNSENLKYSNLTPLLEEKSLTPDYAYSLKYITPSFKKLSKYIEEVTIGTIASDMDYHLPLQGNSNYLGMIPNPIALSKESEGSNQKKGTTILLGINTNNYTKKGLKYFDEALTRIEKKYPNVIIKKTTNLPFKDYMAEVKKADILLDQIYGYDQGYNALQAMALGKVVFTGAEQAFLAYYNLKEDEVAINALPDVDYLVHKLSSLIESPKKTKTIGANAKAFVLKHHKAKEVAKKYVETWINAAQ